MTRQHRPEEERIKVIVAGSRTFKNYQLLSERLDHLLSELDDPILVSGGAAGADKLGERYAFENLLEMRIYHADWDAHGKSAGPVRNGEMVAFADVLIAFWDGKSPGTKDVIEQAKRKNLQVKVVRI